MIEKYQIKKEALDAIDEYTGGCTVVIASTDPKINHGSGVAVRYGDKQYILTAAHVVKDEPRDHEIKIIGKANSP